ncbi:hypothetical protein VNI00_018354 [Paramarasmius palmivorus]|uniref:HMG domain-containing protein n=1 Tax=Paramarasmius palmivorus TaxID=297713 RepID=A0AAW0AZM8_9AGAR
MVDPVNAGTTDERAISYLPILPPAWASLPEDPILYPRPSPSDMLPPLLSLDELSRSACGKNYFEPVAPILQRECTIYTLSRKAKCLISVQLCPTCPAAQRCYIGPDLRTVGIFNFNNSVLFTHELLDEYTNRYTGSETPFAAFVLTIARVYTGRGDKFVGEDLFRAAWFAFASLQHMAGDMFCRECGVAPETVIWDGVTVSFAKRHLQDTLQPPTHIPPDAIARDRIRYSSQQWIVSKNDARVQLANWIKIRGGDGAGNGGSRHNDFEFLQVVKSLIEGGAEPVANALYEVFGRGRDRKTQRRYRMLFEQVRML